MASLKVSVNLGEGYSDPMRFVECAVVAEKYGFDSVWFGDHLLPWVHSQNRSAFVWSVMPTALDRTKKIKVGPVVTCPIGGRYHPIIIGQASATIDNMYPGRFLLGVGSGEAMSEAMFFPQGWPKWRERIERLSESTALMKKMWESRTYFTFEGKHFKMNDFFLYTKPKARIPVYFSAIGKKAAEYAGTYGDHLVTANTPEACRDLIFPIFESSARKSGKDPSKMEKMVEMLLHFGDKKHATEEIKKSGYAGVFSEGAFDERDPRRIQEMARQVSDDIILANHYFFDPPDELIGSIEKFQKAGATHVELVTHSFPDRIKLLGEKVLPHFKKKK